MTVEEKVIASVRSILIADPTISALVQTNVYAAHISSILKPIYPAISLHLLAGPGASFDAYGYVNVNLQIDCWFPSQQYDLSSVLSVQERLRALLHRQMITDSTIPVAGAGYERSTGQYMVEEDTKLIHLPLFYTFTAF